MLWNRVYGRGKGSEAHNRKNLKWLEENVIRNVNVQSALVKFQGLSWWFRWWRICPQCGRPEFDCWVRKIPWRREWLPTPVFLPWEFHGQRSLVGYSPWGRNTQVGHNWAANSHFFTGGNEEHVFGNWKQGSCYKAAEDLAELYSLQQEVEHISNKPG